MFEIGGSSMSSYALRERPCGARIAVIRARVVILTMLVLVGSLFVNREANANAAMVAAAESANAGLAACGNNRGKALY
jgi:hypothetical protein